MHFNIKIIFIWILKYVEKMAERGARFTEEQRNILKNIILHEENGRNVL